VQLFYHGLESTHCWRSQSWGSHSSLRKRRKSINAKPKPCFPTFNTFRLCMFTMSKTMLCQCGVSIL
jgi:hypothetical protein